MSRKLALMLLVFGLMLTIAGLPAVAQDEETTTTTVSLVSVPPRLEITDINLDRYPRVTMTVDLRNVPDLDPNAISITENGEPVSDLEVNTLEQSFQRIGIVLAIDTSGSMQGEPIEAAKTAALSFIAQKRPQDWMALITFASEVQVLSGFTNDPVALSSRIETIEAGGETAFFDAVIKSAELYTDISNDERNLIILTDGADSIYSGDEKDVAKQDALDAVAEAGVRVFGVALEGSEFSPDDLRDFSTATEGLFRATPDPQQLDSLYGDIRRELNNKLVLRFTANEQQTTDVEYSVSYESLTGNATVAVPGFATTTLASTTTSQAFVFVAPGSVVIPDRGNSTSAATLRLVATFGVFAALALFVLIVVRMEADSDGDVGSRLKAYGRTSGPGTAEGATGLLGRIPFLRKFTERAEEAARRRGLLTAINSALEQGNIPLRPGEAMAAGVGLSVIAAVLVGLFTQNPAFGLGGFALALLILAGAVQLAGEREKRRFESQLPPIR